MSTIESVVHQINKELVPQFEARLREHLASQDREWLIEQIVRLTLDAHSLHEKDRRHLQQAKAARRQARIGRLQQLAVDRSRLVSFIAEFSSTDRETLIRDNHLLPTAPARGTELITAAFRTSTGEELLMLAKDLFFRLLIWRRRDQYPPGPHPAGITHPSRAAGQGGSA